METIIEKLTALIGWLASSTLHTTVLICLVLLIKGLFSKKLSPRWHYCLWLLVLARILIPWTPPSSLSIFNLLPEYGPSSSAIQSPVIDANPIDNSIAENLSIASMKTTAQETFTLTPAAKSSVLTEEQQGLAPKVSSRLSPTAVLSAVWLSGSVVLACYIFACNFRLWQMVRKQHIVRNRKILDLMEVCKNRMGVRTKVTAVLTDMIKTPALFGFLRPRLLLPVEVIKTFSNSEIRHIILHEMAHLKRNDIIFGWLASLGLIIHWFNPLVWFAFYRMRIDRELACDALVLSKMDNTEYLGYGRTMLHLLQTFSSITKYAGLAAVLEDKAQLKRRLIMISCFDKKRYSHSMLALIIVAVLSCSVLTSAVPKEREPRPMEELVPARLHRNLVVYYAFDSLNDKNVVNIAGEKYDGRIRKAQNVPNGLIGGAMKFDGNDSYVTIGNLSLPQFTFCGWVKPDKEGQDLNKRRIFLIDSVNDFCSIQSNGSGGISVSIGQSSEIDEEDSKLSADGWSCLAVTFDGNLVKIYLDGKLVASEESGKNRGFNGSAYIAFSGNVPSDSRHDDDLCWDGLIDEVGIYDKALSDRDVKAIYDLGASASVFARNQQVRNNPSLMWWKESADCFDRINGLAAKNDWQQMMKPLSELSELMDKYNNGLNSQAPKENEIKTAAEKCLYSSTEYSSLLKLTDVIKNICGDLTNAIRENKDYTLKDTYGLLYRKWIDFEKIVKAETDVKYQYGWTPRAGGGGGGSASIGSGSSGGSGKTQSRRESFEWNNDSFNIDMQRKQQFIEMYGDEHGGAAAGGMASSGGLSLTGDDIGKFKTRAQMCLHRMESLNDNAETMKKENLDSDINLIKQNLDLFRSALMLDQVRQKLEQSGKPADYDQIKYLRNLEMLKNSIEGYAEDENKLQQINKMVSDMADMAGRMAESAKKDDRAQVKMTSEKLFASFKEFADIFNIDKSILRESREARQQKMQEEMRQRIRDEIRAKTGRDPIGLKPN